MRILTALTLLLALIAPLTARTLYPGQWAQSDPATSDWFSKARRPGSDPKADWHAVQSCCGEADAYEADEFEVDNGEVTAIITEGDQGQEEGKISYCDDANEERENCKVFIPPGTRIHVPKDKIVTDQEFLRKNPTGHGWVWLNGSAVLCYVFPSGI
jgi:hypothetical protein